MFSANTGLTYPIYKVIISIYIQFSQKSSKYDKDLISQIFFLSDIFYRKIRQDSNFSSSSHIHSYQCHYKTRDEAAYISLGICASWKLVINSTCCFKKSQFSQSSFKHLFKKMPNSLSTIFKTYLLDLLGSYNWHCF